MLKVLIKILKPHGTSWNGIGKKCRTQSTRKSAVRLCFVSKKESKAIPMLTPQLHSMPLEIGSG